MRHLLGAAMLTSPLCLLIARPESALADTLDRLLVRLVSLCATLFLLLA